jgi:hypothetical protein
MTGDLLTIVVAQRAGRWEIAEDSVVFGERTTFEPAYKAALERASLRFEEGRRVQVLVQVAERPRT